MRTWYSLVVLYVCVSGCRTVGNVLLPPHPNSDAVGSEMVSLELLESSELKWKTFDEFYKGRGRFNVSLDDIRKQFTTAGVHSPDRAPIEESDVDSLAAAGGLPFRPAKRPFCEQTEPACQEYERLRNEYRRDRAEFHRCYEIPDPVRVPPELEPSPAGDAISSAGLTETALTMVIKAASVALKAESKRYEATYSNRNSGILLDLDPGKRLGLIRFTRVVSDKGAPREVMRMDSRILFSADDRALRLQPVFLALSSTKSKVAKIPRPSCCEWRWLWPWMWAHAVYGWVSADAYNVDTDIVVTIDTIAGGASVERSIEIPLGKVNINDERSFPLELTCNRLKGIRLPYVPIAADGKRPVRVNVGVTVREANELGGILGAASKATDDNADKISESILGKVGSKKEEEGKTQGTTAELWTGAVTPADIEWARHLREAVEGGYNPTEAERSTYGEIDERLRRQQ